MPTRSQAHLLRVGRFTSGGVNPVPAPPITDINPKSGGVANVGAAGRLITAVTAAGGTAPFTWSITTNPDNIGVAFTGANLLTTTNPVHAATGTHNIGVRATDARGQTRDISFAVLLS